MFAEAADGSGAFEFSTDRLPEQDRVRLWRDVIARQGMRVESQPTPGSVLKVDIRGFAWPGLSVIKASLSGMRDERTRELIGDGADEINLIINVSGPVTITARGNEVHLGDGEGFAFSSSEPTVFDRPSPGSIVGLVLPREALQSRIRNLDTRLVRVIAAGSDLQLLSGYLAFLLDNKAPVTAELRGAITAHLHQLAALVLGPSPAIAAAMEGLGSLAARLVAIKADAIENLGNRDLTTGWLARRHHVSARYIQMIFENEQTTLSAFLLDQRLQRIDRLLADLANSGRSISSMALECGFGDLSYFNRAFRTRYGMTPSQRRAGTARQSQG